MEGVLVNLQLAPQAVVCLAHPLNNTEDFAPGVFLDNTGAIGHDLLSDPARHFIAEQTLQADGMVVAGPLALKQCSGCDPTVANSFIARLPIDFSMPDSVPATNATTTNNNRELHPLSLQNLPKRWGFAVAIINWNELIGRSDVYQLFRDRPGWEFQLTRSDTLVDHDTNLTTQKVSSLLLHRHQRLMSVF